MTTAILTSSRRRGVSARAACDGATMRLATLPGLFRLKQRDRVAVGILEPGRAADAGRCRNAVDRLQRRVVVLLERDTAGLELRDVGGHVIRPEAHLRVVRLIRAR